MRKRLWIQFHLWTLGLVAVLTVANIATVLRPYSAANKASTVTPSLFMGETSATSSGRAPASSAEIETVVDSRLALKTARVGCEASSRLRVVSAVRQLRLQFDNCAAPDAVVGVQNKTNGFEATVFGLPANAAEPQVMAGTFSTPEAKVSAKTAAAKAAKTPAIRERTIAAEKQVAQERVSTDYISLAEGENEITIRRSGREQLLKIERK